MSKLSTKKRQTIFNKFKKQQWKIEAKVGLMIRSSGRFLIKQTMQAVR